MSLSKRKPTSVRNGEQRPTAARSAAEPEPVDPRLGGAFWQLFGSSAASNLADGVSRAVVPLLAASLTRDPLLISAVTSLSFLPWLLFALPAGTLVDRSDRRRVMGLIESTDGGVTWREKSLTGTADFHGLQVAHGSVYGYNSVDGEFMVSADQRQWERRSRTTIGAFAVSPTDGETVLAVGRDGLQRSTDGGRSWQPVPDAPAVGLLAWDHTGVWAVAPDGAVWSSSDGGGQWQRHGAVPGEPHSFAVQDDTLFAALAGDRIVASTDGGAAWTDRYAST